MRAFSRILPLFAVALLVGAGAAQAQYGGRRRDRGHEHGIREVRDREADRSFWFGLGLGGGNESVKFTGQEFYGDEVTAPSFTARLGGTPNRMLRVGAEAFVWGDQQNLNDHTVGSFLFIGQFYPAGIRQGFYLKGGLGLAWNRERQNGFTVFSDGGYGSVLGAGYEIRAGRHFSVAPTIDLHTQSYNNPGVVNDYRERVVNLGVSVVFR
jgi:hypothetical protein